MILRNIIPVLKYLKVVIKHKWFVLVAGYRINKLGLMKISWVRLLFHDISKLSFDELPYYGVMFFGTKEDREAITDDFNRAWVHHQNANDHHWEWYVARTGHNKTQPAIIPGSPIRMDQEALLEMMADWFGASRSYEGKWPDIDTWPWLNKNLPIIKLHQSTRREIDVILYIIKHNKVF